jgi:hypothetical protein
MKAASSLTADARVSVFEPSLVLLVRTLLLGTLDYASAALERHFRVYTNVRERSRTMAECERDV